MAKKKQESAEDPEVVIQSAIGRTELFLQKNAKALLTGLGIVVIIVGGIFAYKYLYSEPRQQKATEAMYQAQNYFASEMYSAALDGDEVADGFLEVIKTYGSTRSGNLAKHYAGQCYLRLGEYDNAIKYFEMYSDVKGIPAQIVNANNAGFIGDAYIQQGNLEKGMAQYEKAVSVSDNTMTAPYYLRKAGQVAEALNNNAKALELYNKVKNLYPTSTEAREIDKYIARVEQKL